MRAALLASLASYASSSLNVSATVASLNARYRAKGFAHDKSAAYYSSKFPDAKARFCEGNDCDTAALCYAARFPGLIARFCVPDGQCSRTALRFHFRQHGVPNHRLWGCYDENATNNSPEAFGVYGCLRGSSGSRRRRG